MKKKKILRWALTIILAPITLFIIAATLLYIPPIQDYAVKKAAQAASQATNMNVEIGRLRLIFLFNIDLQNVEVSDSTGDRLLSVEQLKINLSFPKLLHGEIDVEGIDLNNATVNTKQLLDGMMLKGSIKRFFADSHGIALPGETVVLNNLELNDTDLYLELNDTTKKEKEEEADTAAINWKIDIRNVSLTNINLALAMPPDSMTLKLHGASAALQKGMVDLATGLYTLETFTLNVDTLLYDLPYEEPTPGLDANHIALTGTEIQIDSIRFDAPAIALNLNLSKCQTKEKSGLELSSLTGNISMDSTALNLTQLLLRTPDSYLQAQAHMDFAAVSQEPTGNLWARLQAELGKQDVMLLAGNMPDEFIQAYPNSPIIIRLAADGNMQHLNLTTAETHLDNAFEIELQGTAHNLNDSTRMAAEATLALKTYNIDMLKTLAEGALDSITLPPLSLNGTATMLAQNYTAELELTEGNGKAYLDAQFDAAHMAYEATLNVDSMQLRNFMQGDSLGILTTSAYVKGIGTDPLSPSTSLTAQLKLDCIDYNPYSFGGITLNADWKNNTGTVNLESDNSMLQANTRLDASATKEQIDATLDLNIQRANLQELMVSENPLDVGMRLQLTANSNMTDAHEAHGTISNISLTAQDSTYRPKDVALNLLLLPDTTHADLSAGDFSLALNGREGLDNMLNKITQLTDVISKQIENYELDQDTLKNFLPNASLYISAGKENPISNYLALMGYSFEELRLKLDANTHDGLNGGGHVFSINSGSVEIDTVLMHIYQDSTGVQMDARVKNGPNNPQFVFDAKANAYLHSNGAGIDLVYMDKDNIKGVDLGLRAELSHNGIRLTLPQTHPVLAYRNFTLNDDNYIALDNDYHLEANLTLRADDGTAIRIYSTPNDNALQDLTLELQNINLQELTNVIPYAPRLNGMLQTDAHVVVTETQQLRRMTDASSDDTNNEKETDADKPAHLAAPPPLHLSAAAEVTIDSLVYEGAELGDVGLDLVYLPRSEKEHFVDVRLLHNDNEVLMLLGGYTDDGNAGQIKADATLSNFPLTLANGFIPDQMAELDGCANGKMSIQGSLDKPVIDGWFATTGMKINSSPYSLNMTLADDTITVVQSHLDLDQLSLYSTGENPLVMDGTVDFADFEHITLDLQVNATDFEVINAKKTQEAVLYGQVYVNLGMKVSGDLNNLDVAGQLDLSGNTDVTYVLKDSPLTVEDRLSDLVTFTDFSDTLTVEEPETTQPMSINMLFKLGIDETAQVHCLLSADRSSYVDLEGGGDLTLIYTPQGEMTLTGRYTVQSGEMKYSLPVIPLKTFTITSGSYIDFNGPVLNPTLNIAATESTRATVTQNDDSRSVMFEVGLEITQTLEDMGLQFTIEAPEDMTVQNEIAAMSAEEKNKTAVTLLATGMYISPDGSTSGFSTTDALNAMLQSEISNIAGRALESVDFSVGIDQQTTAEGTNRTDYSFQFSKKLWNNRVSIVVGGKVSTGEDVENTGESIIDNIALEYRLDKNATRYVTVYYDRGYESLLEGEITEMGAGLVLRKKMAKIGELFIFRNKKEGEDETNESNEM